VQKNPTKSTFWTNTTSNCPYRIHTDAEHTAAQHELNGITSPSTNIVNNYPMHKLGKSKQNECIN